MGLYDVINGEQVKVFSTPLIGMPDFILSSCLSFGGGSLNSYEKGDKIPYKSYCYNLTKDFNIIDTESYQYDYPIIHIIRDGINKGCFSLNNIENNELKYSNYSDHGIKLDINIKDDIFDYLEKLKAFRTVLINQDCHNQRAFFNYARTHKFSDNDENFNKLKDLYEQERENNELLRKPYIEDVNKFYLLDDNLIDYYYLGGFCEGLSHERFNAILDDNHKFIVSDERLTFIVAYNELKSLINSNGSEFIEDYFKVLDFSKECQNDFREKLNMINELYIKLYERTFEKDQFDEYILKDINTQRYKEYYIKYNILPYDNFKWE